jgi:uncharacterized protein YndB with AHSA1/START domain
MSAATDASLRIVARGDREIVLSRLFAAPRALVFDAFTVPALLQRWYGRNGWTLPECEIDLRAGGAYRYLMRGPDGSEMIMRGTFLDVQRPNLLVTSEAFEGSDMVGWRPEDATVTTSVFADEAGQTRWTSTTCYPTSEAREGALNLAPAMHGLRESLQRLDRALLTPPG